MATSRGGRKGLVLPQARAARGGGLWRLSDHLPGLAIVAVGLLLAVLGIVLSRTRAVAEEQRSLERRAAGITQTLEVSLDVWVEVLEQLTTFFESSTDVTRRDFHDFARPVLRRYSEIGGLAWCPLVADETRAAVEAQTQREGFPGFQFREAGPSGVLERVEHRAEYLPVLYLEPQNEMALGLDLYFSAERRAPADAARDLGRPVASPRRNMVHDPPNVYTVILHSPVYERGAPLATLEQRRAAFVGVTLELLRIEQIIERALSDADLTNLKVELLDLSASGPERTLWESAATQPSERAQRWSRELEFAERRWALSFASEPVPLASTTLPWWPILFCVGASLVLASFVSARRMAKRLRKEIMRAKTVGAYKLLDKLRGGGMAEVYRARHVLLRRPTALKVFNRPHKEAELRRFEREVRLTANLSHPNTIVIFDYGRTENNLFYYAMEYIDGVNLETLVHRYGPIPPGRVIRIMRQVCAALAEAHGVGLVHRDIKPSNIMVCDRGGIADMVKVLDFGLVRRVNANDTTPSESGAWRGTPPYLAPETVTHPDRVDQRVDIYALGLVMHFLLTGVRSVQGETLTAMFYQIVHVSVVRPSELAEQPIPEGLEAVIMKCVEKDPERRFSNIVELEQALPDLDAHDWTENDAREWWSAWREKKKKARTMEPALGELTVDLEGRQPLARDA